ncbi:MAG TPA: TetR/AcrR family transcriptional regulator [Micromonosporaceae bacterium]|nr:TetR/AcrR family transcriptional regulator [Micromonosporaceae bacterium]
MSYPEVTPSAASPDGARERLMVAFAQAMGEKGYAGTTIADIVAVARVSKRTFYEHFSDKEECLLAVYAEACGRLVEVVRAAATVQGPPWRERVRATAHAYLTAIDAMPTVSRALLVEVQAAGPRAFALRRRMQERFADVLRDLVEQGRVREPEVRPLSRELALALVGGINELLLHAVDPYGDRPPPAAATDLTGAVTELVWAVLSYREGA